MKKPLRRLLALIMSLTTFVSAISTVSATQAAHNSARQSALIEKDREELYQLLVDQLAAQDALEYIDQFTYLIDATINEKYSVATTYANTKKYAPNGGCVVGANSQYQREAEYLNPDQTQELYLNRYGAEALLRDLFISAGIDAAWALAKKTILKKILNQFPASILLTYITLPQFLQSANQLTLWSKITIGVDGCIISSVYDKQNMNTITIMWPWKTQYIDLSIYPSNEHPTHKLH